MNEDFVDTAFSDAEQALILLTEVENLYNVETKTLGGNNTFDYVYLLSQGEVYQYLHMDNSPEGEYQTQDSRSGAKPTEYAIAQGCEAFTKELGWYQDWGWYQQKCEGNCIWILRSPARHNNYGYDVCYIDYNTEMDDCSGTSIDYEMGIRPVMWIDLSQTGISANTTVPTNPNVSEDIDYTDDSYIPSTSYVEIQEAAMQEELAAREIIETEQQQYLQAVLANANPSVTLLGAFETGQMSGWYFGENENDLEILIYTAYDSDEDLRAENGCEIGTCTLDGKYTFLYKIDENTYFFLPHYYMTTYEEDENVMLRLTNAEGEELDVLTQMQYYEP